jgi:hypothetical protein
MYATSSQVYLARAQMEVHSGAPLPTETVANFSDLRHAWPILHLLGPYTDTAASYVATRCPPHGLMHGDDKKIAIIHPRGVARPQIVKSIVEAALEIIHPTPTTAYSLDLLSSISSAQAEQQESTEGHNQNCF